MMLFMTTVLTTIVVRNNGIVGLTDAKIGCFTNQKGLFLMYLVGNDEIFVIRIPPAPPNLMKLPPFFVQRCTMNGDNFYSKELP